MPKLRTRAVLAEPVRHAKRNAVRDESFEYMGRRFVVQPSSSDPGHLFCASCGKPLRNSLHADLHAATSAPPNPLITDSRENGLANHVLCLISFTTGEAYEP